VWRFIYLEAGNNNSAEIQEFSGRKIPVEKTTCRDVINNLHMKNPIATGRHLPRELNLPEYYIFLTINL